jgi:hypothetical protein
VILYSHFSRCISSSFCSPSQRSSLASVEWRGLFPDVHEHE